MIPLRRATCALAALVISQVALGGAPAIAANHHAARPTVNAVDTSSIQLTEIAPAVIPTQGAVVLNGTLYNGSSETWHHLSVVPANSYYPLSTGTNLAAAATSDPAEITLGRSLPDLGAALPDLAPGASTTFTISIPRDKMQILGNAGVYWLGVTPTSDEDHPRELTTRTFLPLLPQRVNPSAHVNISLVVPLRSSPLRSSTGALADPVAFTSLVSDAGRLGRIVSFAQKAAGRPLTWLVDPALLDLAADDVAGTTSYPVSAFSSSPPTATAPPAANGAPSSPSASGSPTGSPPTPLTADQVARLKVRDWLNATITLLKSSSVYALPYADPSIASLVGTGHVDLLTTARALSTQSMTARGLGASPALAPASGALSQAEWSALDQQATAFVNAAATTNTTTVLTDSRTLVVASNASTGGPGPTSATTALNVRQRLLAEAALAASTPATTNLTVVLPSDWDPGATSTIDGFFGPLTQPWISFTGLPGPTAGTPKLKQASPQISAEQRASVDAAIQLQTATTQLMAVIAPTPTVTSRLTRQLSGTELATMSAEAEASAGSYRANAGATATALRSLLDGVRIDGTQFVTLSGSSGFITVSLANDLNVPVRVGVQQTGTKPRNPVTVATVAPFVLNPGERSTLRIYLSAPRVSVQEVTVTPVSSTGAIVGIPLTFTVRSSPVGTVIWAITIAILLMIALLVGRSIRRRLRAKRALRDQRESPVTHS